MYKMNLSLSIANKKISFRVEVIILIILLIGLIWLFTLGSTCKIGYQEGLNMLGSASSFVGGKIQEGFAGNNVAYTSEWSKAASKPPNTKKWSMGDLIYTPGQKPDKAIKEIWNRPAQPIPLPKGEMLFFDQTNFDPECCPNTYSTSMGCACMTVDQFNYLKDRAGNNVPYSEY